MGQNDSIPRNKLGCILSLSNNIDALQSFFSINLVPTGSRDPFALRRAGNSIIKILIIKKIDMSLDDISNVISLQKISNKENLKECLINFLLDRFKKYLLDKKNYSVGLVESVIYCKNSTKKSLLFLNKLIIELTSFSSSEMGKKFIINYKRIFNILKIADMDKLPEEINQEIFENKYEKKLYDYYSKLLNLKYNDNYNNLIFDASTLALFTESIDIIEKFFDHTWSTKMTISCVIIGLNYYMIWKNIFQILLILKN